MKINESPDNIGASEYNVYTPGAYAFEVICNIETFEIIDVLINEKEGYHHEMPKDPHSMTKIYPGRIFTEQKILTFWTYPIEEELKTIIKIIEKKKNLKIFNNGWEIEIYEEGVINKGSKTYFNNYDELARSYLLPIEDFIGSSKIPEKNRIDHLSRNKRPYIKGWGSDKTAWDFKNNIKTRQAMQTSESQKINENPDFYIDPKTEFAVEWLEGKALPFGYYKNKFYIGSEHGSTHYTMLPAYISRYKYKWPGRIWTETKIISFWVYPPKKSFKRVIDDLSKALDIDIYNDPEWKIEVLKKLKTGEISRSVRGFSKYGGNDAGEWKTQNKKIIDFVPIKRYIGSDNVSTEEFFRGHRLPSRKYGGGSKLTAWDSKNNIKTRQAMQTSEGYYPRFKK